MYKRQIQASPVLRVSAVLHLPTVLRAFVSFFAADKSVHSTRAVDLLKGWQRGGDGVAVEVEGDGTVEIGAVDVNSGRLQPRQDIGFGKTERGSEAKRDHGIGRPHGGQDFWSGRCGAAVMAHF